MSYGPVALVPRRFETSCVALPATVEPYSMATECLGQVYSPPPDDFYPAGARRRNEEGAVIFEYSVKRRSQELHDVLVVVSSGFEELDSAALALSKRVAVTKQCPGKRYRMKKSSSSSARGCCAVSRTRSRSTLHQEQGNAAKMCFSSRRTVSSCMPRWL